LIRQRQLDWESETDVFVLSYHDEGIHAGQLASANLRRLTGIVEEGGFGAGFWRDIDGYEADLDLLRELRNGVAYYNPIANTMGESCRSVPQLAV